MGEIMPCLCRSNHVLLPVNVVWPDSLKFGMFVFDFDKTITNKHTRGAIFQPVMAEPDELRKNFADLEFFRFGLRSHHRS